MQARHFAECQRPLPSAVKSLYRKRRLPGRNYSRVYDWIWPIASELVVYIEKQKVAAAL